MSVVTKAASSATVVTTGWTSPSNAFQTTGDNVYATAAPAKNATVNSDFGFAFALSDFVGASQASDVSISQIVVTCEWKVSTTTAATLGVQLRNQGTGTALGTETTFSSTTESDSIQTITSGVTAADLIAGNLAARVRDTRGNSNTAHTGSLDFVKVDVTYSIAVTHTDSGLGTIALSGSFSQSSSTVDSRSGTIVLSGIASENFVPGSITHSDSGSGTISLSGASSQSLASIDARSGTITLTGAGSQSISWISSAVGSIVLTGSAIESFTGAQQWKPFLLYWHSGHDRLWNIREWLQDNCAGYITYDQTGKSQLDHLEDWLRNNPVSGMQFNDYPSAGTDRLWAIESYLLEATRSDG